MIEWLMDVGAVGGIIIGRGNKSTRKKAFRCHLVDHKPYMGSNPNRRVGKPATNSLSYGTAHVDVIYNRLHTYWQI
jgi:hypothetical protein